MAFNLSLKAVGERLKDAADFTKDAAEAALESGLLQETLVDVSRSMGAAGILCKLGASLLPDASAEQIVIGEMGRTFWTALDAEFEKEPPPVEPGQWREYFKEGGLKDDAREVLGDEFTWLSVVSSKGIRRSSEWPIVRTLGKLAEQWLVGAGASPENAEAARGRVLEAIAKALSELRAENDKVEQALKQIEDRASDEGFKLLAAAQSELDKHLLFKEIPQDTLYVHPRVKICDFAKDAAASCQWDEVEQVYERGDERLLAILSEDKPRLVIIEGDMGVGKSCLMRVLTARLSREYAANRRAPILVRWKGVFDADSPDALLQNIEQQVAADWQQHGVIITDLNLREQVTILIDGFDEMSSHDPEHLRACFDRIRRLYTGGQSVVVAMRSTAVTEGLRGEWEEHQAFVVHVEAFNDEDVKVWVEKWNDVGMYEHVEVDSLQALARREDIVQNPLLLYMLARDVVRAAAERDTRDEGLSESEIFDIFVSSTLSGKPKRSGERHGMTYPEQKYRLLLQETAAIASWPSTRGTCTSRALTETLNEAFLDELDFEHLRTAFVLYFFAGISGGADQFEFQPHSFGEYLLAEWCVRLQIESMPEYAQTMAGVVGEEGAETAKERLSQLVLLEDELRLLNELYEELGVLAIAAPERLAKRLLGFGINSGRGLNSPVGGDEAVRIVENLYEHVRAQAESPSDASPWNANTRVGIPEGQEVPRAFNRVRLLVNHWDQCLIATFGLYRGLGKRADEEAIFRTDDYALSRYLHLRDAVRGFSWGTDIDLSEVNLSGVDLIRANLVQADLRGANLSEADLSLADLRLADLSGAILSGADLRGAIISQEQMEQSRGTPGFLPDDPG